MGELISHSNAQLINSVLDTGDPRDTQRALQLVAWNSHSGRMPAIQLWRRIVGSVPTLYMSPDVKVRRWAYVTTCFLQPKPRIDAAYRAIIAGLETSINQTESDSENRLWASAAIFATLEPSEVTAHLRRCPTEFRAAQLQLAYRLTHPTPLSTLGSADKLFTPSLCDDDVVALWHALLFGYDTLAHSSLPDDAVRTIADLTLHSNSEVAEYSVWSLFHNPCGSSQHLPQPAASLVSQPPSVRRWLYRLLGKARELDPTARRVFEDAMSHEPDDAAREGLALAIENHCPDVGFQRRVMAWYIAESTASVQIALLTHLARHAARSEDYMQLLRETLLFEPAIPKIKSVIRSTIQAAAPRHVMKLLEPKTPRARGEIEMHFNKSIVNFGTMGSATLNSIEQLSESSAVPHRDDVVALLRRLVDAVAVDDQLSPEQRDEIFQYVKRLTTAAATAQADVAEEKTTLRALAGLARELPSHVPTAQFILEVVDKVRGWLLP